MCMLLIYYTHQTLPQSYPHAPPSHVPPPARTTPSPTAQPPEFCSMFDFEWSRVRSKRYVFPNCDGKMDVVPFWKESLGIKLVLGNASTDSCTRKRISPLVSIGHGGYYLRGKHYKSISMSSSIRRDATPDYDPLLSCPVGKERKGVAIVVTGDFLNHGIWHFMAQLHVIWSLLAYYSISPNTVVDVVDWTGTRSIFALPEMERSWTAVFQRLYFDSDLPPPFSLREPSCYQTLVWAETDIMWPGPIWQLSTPDVTVTPCLEGDTFMKPMRLFRDALLSQLPAHPLQTLPRTVCFLTREREYPERAFSTELNLLFRKHAHEWANATGINYLEYAFTSAIPLMEQVTRIQVCDALIGPHGAGLGHVLWAQSKVLVVEWDDKYTTRCRSYYGNLARSFGHRYFCYNEIPGSNVTADERNAMFVGMNVELFFAFLGSQLSLG